MPYKPAGYSDVSPYLMVKDARATLEFLAAAFDATELRVIPRDGGTGILHAEARIGDSVVMMGEVSDAQPSSVHVYVPDVRATFDRAMAAGGTEVQKPLDQNDGDLRAGVADPNGIIWWPSTQLPLT